MYDILDTTCKCLDTTCNQCTQGVIRCSLSPKGCPCSSRCRWWWKLVMEFMVRCVHVFEGAPTQFSGFYCRYCFGLGSISLVRVEGHHHPFGEGSCGNQTPLIAVNSAMNSSLPWSCSTSCHVKTYLA